jgi:hypothetical protein
MEGSMIAIISDPYGNYVITDMISSWPLDVCEQVFKSLHSQLNELCT